MPIPVDLAPGVIESLRSMRDRGTTPPRCAKGAIRSAVRAAVRRLAAHDVGASVRPWDLTDLRRRAADLGEVRSALALSVGENMLVAELRPGGQWIVFRGAEDGWRLVRFADGDDVSIRPESTRRVTLSGWGPDSVLAALDLIKPDGVELDVKSEDLGQGQTRTTYRYHWADGSRFVLAEEVKTEIYDGATPSSTYVRGVIVDGDHGVLLTGSGDTALIIEG